MWIVCSGVVFNLLWLWFNSIESVVIIKWFLLKVTSRSLSLWLNGQIRNEYIVSLRICGLCKLWAVTAGCVANLLTLLSSYSLLCLWYRRSAEGLRGSELINWDSIEILCYADCSDGEWVKEKIKWWWYLWSRNHGCDWVKFRFLLWWDDGLVIDWFNWISGL